MTFHAGLSQSLLVVNQHDQFGEALLIKLVKKTGGNTQALPFHLNTLTYFCEALILAVALGDSQRMFSYH